MPGRHGPGAQPRWAPAYREAEDRDVPASPNVDFSSAVIGEALADLHLQTVPKAGVSLQSKPRFPLIFLIADEKHGANIAGFVKTVNAMIDQGVV